MARIQYYILSKYPYQFTSDDIFFQVHAERNDLTKSELEKGRQLFFSKGQRNEEGKIAL